MEKMRVLIANGPRIYREVIAAGLKKMRPLVEVNLAEPEELEWEVARLRPHLLISSRVHDSIRTKCLRWMVLYPNGEHRAEIGGAGVGGVEGAALREVVSGVEVADLLRIVDETGIYAGLLQRPGSRPRSGDSDLDVEQTG